MTAMRTSVIWEHWSGHGTTAAPRRTTTHSASGCSASSPIPSWRAAPPCRQRCALAPPVWGPRVTPRPRRHRAWRRRRRLRPLVSLLPRHRPLSLLLPHHRPRLHRCLHRRHLLRHRQRRHPPITRRRRPFPLHLRHHHPASDASTALSRRKPAPADQARVRTARRSSKASPRRSARVPASGADSTW